jgi:flagellar biosynthesis protein FliP
MTLLRQIRDVQFINGLYNQSNVKSKRKDNHMKKGISVFVLPLVLVIVLEPLLFVLLTAFFRLRARARGR